MSGGPPATRSAVHVALAAENVVASLDWLTWSGSRVVLLRRGPDDLWTSIAARLRDERGVSVIDIERPADDRDMYYDPAGPILAEHSLAAGDLLIHHDPLVARAGPAPCDEIRALAARGVAAVSLEFPSGRLAQDRIRDAYLRALGTRPSEIAHRAAALCTALAEADTIWVEDGPSVLRLGPGPVLDDRTAPQTADQLLQLPLGEVWVLPDRATAGRFRIPPGPDDVAVEAGRVRSDGWPHGDLVEVGIGVNPSAAALPSALGEKTHGRVHLGFGDSALLGGDTTGPRHADVYLAPTARLFWRDRNRTIRTLSDVLR